MSVSAHACLHANKAAGMHSGSGRRGKHCGTLPVQPQTHAVAAGENGEGRNGVGWLVGAHTRWLLVVGRKMKLAYVYGGVGRLLPAQHTLPHTLGCIGEK